MRFARRVFSLACVYGLAILLPMYLLEDFIGRMSPPAIAHPEFFYGFVGVAGAWQFVYLIVALDPARYRPLMLLSAIAKLSLVLATVVLVARGRTSILFALPVLGDLVFGVLFVYAYGLVARECRA